MDEPVPGKYYFATGVTAMIACFLSAVQGDTGVFFRVREILILVFKTDVHPLWVFVPAFLMGASACWIERPKNSRSVLIAGLASFSLFGFAPYSKGVEELKADVRTVVPQNHLVIHTTHEYPPLDIIIRSEDFQIYQRATLGPDDTAIPLRKSGKFWLEINGDEEYRTVIYEVNMTESGVELTVELKRVNALEGFLQKFRQAARPNRH